MNNATEPLDLPILDEWPCRVALPYTLDLLQLTRWVGAATRYAEPPRFEIFDGERSHVWSGADSVDLFIKIQRHCMNQAVSHSMVSCGDPNSALVFDLHRRFTFFSASAELMQELYPYSREVLWENFVLLQQEDGDLQHEELFRRIHSRQVDSACD